MTTDIPTAEPARRMALQTFAIRVAAAGLAYGLQVALARVMGVEQYGVFVVVWTAVTMVGVIAGLGLETVVVRSAPRLAASAEWALLRGLVTAARRIAFAGGALIASLAILVVVAVPSLVGEAYRVPVILAAGALPMFAVTEIQDGAARAHDWISLALLPTFVVRPLFILAGLAVLVALGHEVDAGGAAAAALAATWATAAIQFLVVERRLAATMPPTAPRFLTRTWIGEGLPILAVDISLVLLTGVDVLIVGRLSPPSDVGIYYAAAKSLAIVHFVYFAVRTASGRRLADLARPGADRAALAAYVARAARWTFWPSLGLALAVVAAGPLLLALFGKAFGGGHPVMAVLALGILARASIGPAEMLLTMAGRQDLTARIVAATLAITVAGCLTLTPMFGVLGAAMATAAAMAVESALFALAIRQVLGLDVFVFAPGPRPGTAARGA